MGKVPKKKSKTSDFKGKVSKKYSNGQIAFYCRNDILTQPNLWIVVSP